MCFVDDGSGGLLGVIFHFSGGALSPIRPPIHINGGGHVTLQGGWWVGCQATKSAVTAEKKVASNLSVFLQRNTTKVRRN